MRFVLIFLSVGCLFLGAPRPSQGSCGLQCEFRPNSTTVSINPPLDCVTTSIAGNSCGCEVNARLVNNCSNDIITASSHSGWSADTEPLSETTVFPPGSSLSLRIQVDKSDGKGEHHTSETISYEGQSYAVTISYDIESFPDTSGGCGYAS